MFWQILNLILCGECYFISLTISVIIVNKYVLSVLHFTIPTVFQGWQTFVCVVLLTFLIKWKKFRIDIQWVERRIILRLLFPMMCFSLGNVAGSKSLASLPVAVFLAGSNLIPSFLILIRKPQSSLNKIGAISIISSILALYVQYTDHESGWFWLLIHNLSQIAYVLTIAPLQLSHSITIYYSNFSSVLILLPLSIYLQEASHALNHARNASMEFFIGCVLSGILGTGLQLVSGNLKDKANTSLFQGVAKILACSASLIFFPNDIAPLGWLLIVVNLVMGCFVFVSENPVNDGNKLVEISSV